MLCVVVLWKRSHYSDIILKIDIQSFYTTQLNISLQIKQSYLFDLFSKVITDH